MTSVTSKYAPLFMEAQHVDPLKVDHKVVLGSAGTIAEVLWNQVFSDRERAEVSREQGCEGGEAVLRSLRDHFTKSLFNREWSKNRMEFVGAFDLYRERERVSRVLCSIEHCLDFYHGVTLND